ncbi:MAG: YHS domain-containing protein [Deltaproteobacteria bacterium]
MAKIKKKNEEKGKKSFIVWITVVGAFLIISYAAFMGIKSAPPKHPAPAQPTFNKEEVEDPVCGMEVKPPAAGHIEYRSKRYYFCGLACKEDFQKEPGKYLKGKGKKEAHK